jgi:ubiquinone/menaquinone biosynthesis C-methylase UbiE
MSTSTAGHTGRKIGNGVQRWVWDRRAASWEEGGAVGLQPVLDTVLSQAAVHPGDLAVDLGCGTGQLALPLARAGARVTAVDLSGAMIELLLENTRAQGLSGVEGVVSAVESLRLPPSSVDVVVSNYTLHHLRDPDKEALVRSVTAWLRPGGRFVVGDMMFGRGRTARDREIIRSKMSTLLRRGPAGWWRVAKNVARFTLRFQERPISADRWQRLLEEAGLVDVTLIPVVAEAVVVSGRKPDPT